MPEISMGIYMAFLVFVGKPYHKIKEGIRFGRVSEGGYRKHSLIILSSLFAFKLDLCLHDNPPLYRNGHLPSFLSSPPSYYGNWASLMQMLVTWLTAISLSRARVFAFPLLESCSVCFSSASPQAALPWDT